MIQRIENTLFSFRISTVIAVVFINYYVISIFRWKIYAKKRMASTRLSNDGHHYPYILLNGDLQYSRGKIKSATRKRLRTLIAEKILYLKLKYGISGRAISAILKAINTYIAEAVPATIHRVTHDISQYIRKSSSVTISFCRRCNFPIKHSALTNKTRQLTCPLPNCAQKNDLSAKDNILVYTSIREQICQIFQKKPHLLTHLQTVFSQRQRNISQLNSSAIAPVQSIICTRLRTPSFLTMNLFFDGMAIFSSSQRGLYSFQLLLNELPYGARMSNIMLCGLYCGSCKPPHTILKELIAEIRDLAVHGVKLTDSFNNIPVFLVRVTADAVARPFLQGLQQFNGEFGCTWCVQPCETVPGTRCRVYKVWYILNCAFVVHVQYMYRYYLLHVILFIGPEGFCNSNIGEYIFKNIYNWSDLCFHLLDSSL